MGVNKIINMSPCYSCFFMPLASPFLGFLHLEVGKRQREKRGSFFFFFLSCLFICCFVLFLFSLTTEMHQVHANQKCILPNVLDRSHLLNSSCNLSPSSYLHLCFVRKYVEKFRVPKIKMTRFVER